MIITRNSHNNFIVFIVVNILYCEMIVYISILKILISVKPIDVSCDY